MNDALLDVLDPPRSRLRLLAASVEKHVNDLSTQGQTSELVSGLQHAWLALSKELALGPEPVLRSCTHCSRRIPREATRCRYCMAQSPSLADHAQAASEP